MATNNAINTPLITLGGPFTMSGAYSFTGTLTNTTAVTFPTSGTLATTAAGFTWSNVTGASQAMVATNGYVSSDASECTFTLPATGAIGDRVAIQGAGSAGWTITYTTGQLIRYGSATTTTTTGSLSSTNQFDHVELVCIVTNTTWAAFGTQGNLTVV